MTEEILAKMFPDIIYCPNWRSNYFSVNEILVHLKSYFSWSEFRRSIVHSQPEGLDNVATERQIGLNNIWKLCRVVVVKRLDWQKAGGNILFLSFCRNEAGRESNEIIEINDCQSKMKFSTKIMQCYVSHDVRSFT